MTTNETKPNTVTEQSATTTKKPNPVVEKLNNFLKNVKSYPVQFGLVCVGVVLVTDFWLDFTVMIRFAENHDFVWFTASFVITILGYIAVAYGALKDDEEENLRWAKNALTNRFISLLITTLHLRPLFLASRKFNLVSQNKPEACEQIQKALKKTISARSLYSSLAMMALQTYVLENDSSALIWVSLAFSFFSLSVGFITHFCEGDSFISKAWTMIFVCAQLVLRVTTVSVLVSSIKGFSLFLTIPMIIISLLFAGFINLNSDQKKAFLNALFMTPLVLLVAVGLPGNKVDPAFLTERVKYFLYWRIFEGIVVTIVLIALSAIGTNVILNVWFVILIVLFSLAFMFLARQQMVAEIKKQPYVPVP